MARRGFMAMFGIHEPEPDPRPSGALKFADPSTTTFTARVNTFNEPYSPGAHGEQNGVRSLGRYSDPYQEMNRKRGVIDDSDNDGDDD